MPSEDIRTALTRAVDDGFEAQVDLTCDMIRFPSTRGQEAPVQDFMAYQMRRRGLAVDRFRIDLDQIRHLPGFSPVTVSYDDAWTVVGTHRAADPTGRSLILNGHVDVVPTGPLDMWASPPFEPRRDGDWLYGRGGGDMKAGLIAGLAALDAIDRAGFSPAADVIVQSVIEEECTGNGALSCLARGYRADAVLIPEPLHECLTRAQLGVLWFRVEVRGLPVHASDATEGANAIEAAYELMRALRGLEARWNDRKVTQPLYADHPHPINMNIGRIEGGDWTSSVPAWCAFEVRIAVFPDQPLAEAKAEIEAVLRAAARDVAFLRNQPPAITYHGFEAEGIVLSGAEAPEAVLAGAHRTVFGRELQEIASTATTDSRFFGLYGQMPALVYGPVAEAIHGFDERVSLSSLRQVTQAMTLFIADWCGLVPKA